MPSAAKTLRDAWLTLSKAPSAATGTPTKAGAEAIQPSLADVDGFVAALLATAEQARRGSRPLGRRHP